jgi:hypothetical protein
MGGRYAQTPRHSNGQPHAPGVSIFAILVQLPDSPIQLMLGVPQQSQPDSVREWVASSVQAARHSHIPIVVRVLYFLLPIFLMTHCLV